MHINYQIFVLLLVTFLNTTYCSHGNVIKLVAPTRSVMEFNAGESITLTWSYHFNEDTEELGSFFCGYRNTEMKIFPLALDFKGDDFKTINEIMEQDGKVEEFPFGKLDDLKLSKRTVRSFWKNEGNVRKRGFTIIELKPSDSGEYLCGIHLKQTNKVTIKYGGRVTLQSVNREISKNIVEPNNIPRRKPDSTLIAVIAIGVVLLVLVIGVPIVNGIILALKRRKVLDYSFASDRESFLSCGSDDNELTEYQNK